jgi:hypothetical protein
MQDNTTSAGSTSGATDLSDAVEQTIKTIFESTRSAALAALENSKDKLELGQDLMADGVDRSVSLIKKYPLEAAVASFALGCLIGSFLRRRD